MTDQNGTMEQNGKQDELQQLVGDAVAQAIAAQLPQLQAQITLQVLQALPAPVQASLETPAASEEPGHLVRAVASIHAGSTQKEILRLCWMPAALMVRASRYL